MADDGSQQSKDVWPLPKCYFRVKWDSAEMLFEEVSGLDMEAQTIEYRAGNCSQFAPLKMPGLRKYCDVTMKKGVFKGDNKFFDWFGQVKLNTVHRKPVTISLLDEKGAPTMVWKLANAWPTEISGTDLKANGNEVAVETVVFAHEGVTIQSGG